MIASLVGSEMCIRDSLQAEDIKVKVVSIPCTELFDSQSEEYKLQVLGTKPKVAIEAGSKDFWYKYLNVGDEVIGLDCFGESAPLKDLLEHFGFTNEKVVETCKKVLGK